MCSARRCVSAIVCSAPSICTFSAGTYTGRWFDELHPEFAGSPAYAQYAAVVERGVAGYRRGHTLVVPVLPEDYRWIERVILPLARDGKAVDMLLAISINHKGP
jgi:hypothetical protein